MMLLNISVLIVICLSLQTGEGWLFQRRSNTVGTGRSASNSRSQFDDDSDSSLSGGSISSSRRSNGPRLGSSNRLWSRNDLFNNDDDVEPFPGYTRNRMSDLDNSFMDVGSESLRSEINRHHYPELFRETDRQRELQREMEEMMAELRRDVEHMNRDRIEKERLRVTIDGLRDINDLIARHDAMCSLCMSFRNFNCMNTHCSNTEVGHTQLV